MSSCLPSVGWRSSVADWCVCCSTAGPTIC